MVCLRNILMLTLFTCFCAGELAARSYFLPDYQNKTYKGRTNDGFVKKRPEQICSNFPNTYDEDVPGKNCQPSKPLPGLNCYYCTDFTSACSDEYSATCDGEIIDTCEDSEGIKYKCKDVCADFTHNNECNNTSSGGYCVEPSKEECKSSYCDCIDYCQGMKQYEGAIDKDNCGNGCAEGKEVEGCEGLCLECKVEEVSCSNNKDGNLVDASEMASYMEGAEFQMSPYSSECAALGYNSEASCDSGYQKVGCPFNTTAGLFYHCVPTETYTSSEDTVETCPDGYSTEVTQAACTGDWTTLVSSGTANEKSCNKCDCLFSSESACSNGDLGCEQQTIGDKTCYVPLCKEGWEALMPSQVEQERTTCKEEGNDWNSWDASSYCYRCDVEWQYCDDGYYSIYSKEAYNIKNEGEGNYLCKPQIGANAYERCVQCEVCADNSNATSLTNDGYKKYTSVDIWLDDKQNCEERDRTWQKADGYGCYYKCVDDTGSETLTCDQAIAAKGGVRLKQGMSLQSDTTYYMTENVGHSTYGIGRISNVIVYDASVTLPECANDPTVTANPMIEASQATLIQNTHFYVPVKIRYFSTDSAEDISIYAYNNLWIGNLIRTGSTTSGTTRIEVSDNPYYDDIPLHFKVRAGFTCEFYGSWSGCDIELMNYADNAIIQYCDYSQAYMDNTGNTINNNSISGEGDDVGCIWPDWMDNGEWYDGD